MAVPILLPKDVWAIPSTSPWQGRPRQMFFVHLIMHMQESFSRGHNIPGTAIWGHEVCTFSVLNIARLITKEVVWSHGKLLMNIC